MQCLEVRYVCKKHEKSLYTYDAHKFQMTSPDMKIISRRIEVIFQILKRLSEIINKFLFETAFELKNKTKITFHDILKNVLVCIAK